MAVMPETMKLTPEEQKQLNRLRLAEDVKYQCWVQRERRRGRKDFPLVPYHMSWAFEMEFRRTIGK